MVALKYTNTIAEDGSMMREHVLDYVRHIEHTEENLDVKNKATIVFDLTAVESTIYPTNIDYVVGKDGHRQRDNSFFGNVHANLLVRRFCGDSLPSSLHSKTTSKWETAQYGYVFPNLL